MESLDEKAKKQLLNFYDKDGKLKQYPGKRPLREHALFKIAECFEEGRNYTEKEVNGVILSQISFSDHELIRRELFQYRFLNRMKDGSKYWKEKREN